MIYYRTQLPVGGIAQSSTSVGPFFK